MLGRTDALKLRYVYAVCVSCDFSDVTHSAHNHSHSHISALTLSVHPRTIRTCRSKCDHQRFLMSDSSKPNLIHHYRSLWISEWCVRFQVYQCTRMQIRSDGGNAAMHAGQCLPRFQVIMLTQKIDCNFIIAKSTALIVALRILKFARNWTVCTTLACGHIYSVRFTI